MGCYWSLDYNGCSIDSGNKNCDLKFLNLLLKRDFLVEKGQCLISKAEMRDRLELIGYSLASVKSYLNVYVEELKSKSQSIYFVSEDFRYISPDRDFWNEAQRIDIEKMVDIWVSFFCKKLSVTDKFIFDLITNSFSSEYIEPYFDQMVNYYIISTLTEFDDNFVLDCLDMIESEGWSVENFSEDAFNQLLLQANSEESLIKYSMYCFEEDLTHEFKEIKGQNPISSIKNCLEKYVLSFINSEGGEIIWGITDSREVVGFKADAVLRDKIRKDTISIINNVSPQINPKLYSLDFISIIENGMVNSDVVCFKVKVSSSKIDGCYRGSKGQIWIRQNGVSINVKNTA